jgi:FkbM family methyltransferase
MAVTFDWLKDVHQAMSRCKQKFVAVQAGGNTGVWPKEMAKEFRYVYTFEPDADNFACLATNCQEENIFKFQAALGCAHGMMDLHRDPRNAGAHYVKQGDSFPVMRIDDLHLANCDLIQLDVEGFEYQAVMGAMATIDRCSPVIMVEDKGLSDKYDIPKGGVLRLLSDKGYKVVADPHRDFVLVRD